MKPIYAETLIAEFTGNFKESYSPAEIKALIDSQPDVSCKDDECRLIDANALVKSLGLEDAVKYGNKSKEQQWDSYSTMMLYEIRDAIDAQPTVDKYGRPTAEWYYDGALIKCSVCNTHPERGFQTSYCPTCGAKMTKFRM